MDLVELPVGVFHGTVDGPESGHCTARVEGRVAPGGCRTVDYEATSQEHGLQHVEHTLVSDGALVVAFAEARGFTVMHQTAPGVVDADGLRIVASTDGRELRWGWHWGVPPMQRSCAVVDLAS